MTTHRIDEPIVLTLHSLESLYRHIRRPRSQKGVAYCGERLASHVSDDGIEIVIPDPSNIPLAIDLERDFAGLCRKCARTFLDEVRGELPGRMPESLVPTAWQLIFARTERHSPPLKIREDRDGFDSIDPPDQLGRARRVKT